MLGGVGQWRNQLIFMRSLTFLRNLFQRGQITSAKPHLGYHLPFKIHSGKWQLSNAFHKVGIINTPHHHHTPILWRFNIWQLHIATYHSWREAHQSRAVMSEINNFLNTYTNGEKGCQVIYKQQARLLFIIKGWLDSVVQWLKGEAVVSYNRKI